MSRGPGTKPEYEMHCELVSVQNGKSGSGSEAKIYIQGSECYSSIYLSDFAL